MVTVPPFYCTNCGAANQPQATFCFACGQSLQASVANTPPIISAATGSLASSHLLKGRYRIVGQLGKGGMGAVYKAEDTLFDNQLLAVKELSQSGLSPEDDGEPVFKCQKQPFSHTKKSSGRCSLQLELFHYKSYLTCYQIYCIIDINNLIQYRLKS